MELLVDRSLLIGTERMMRPITEIAPRWLYAIRPVDPVGDREAHRDEYTPTTASESDEKKFFARMNALRQMARPQSRGNEGAAADVPSRSPAAPPWASSYGFSQVAPRTRSRTQEDAPLAWRSPMESYAGVDVGRMSEPQFFSMMTAMRQASWQSASAQQSAANEP